MSARDYYGGGNSGSYPQQQQYAQGGNYQQPHNGYSQPPSHSPYPQQPTYAQGGSNTHLSAPSYGAPRPSSAHSQNSGYRPPSSDHARAPGGPPGSDAQFNGEDGERGFLATVGGGAAGGYAGKKFGGTLGGVAGAVLGAIVANKVEDKFENRKDHHKHGHHKPPHGGYPPQQQYGGAPYGNPQASHSSGSGLSGMIGSVFGKK